MCRHFAVVDPTGQREIRRFGTVVAVIVASVITVGKRDYKLTGSLGYLTRNFVKKLICLINR